MNSKQPRQKSLFGDESIAPLPWEEAALRDRMVAQVVFNRPVDREFDYLVSDQLRDMLRPGQRVRAPFGRGNRLTVGFCVGTRTNDEVPRKLKSIESVLDTEPLLDDRMLELTRWIANYHLCSWGQVLESVVPAGVKKQAGTRVMSLYSAAPHAAEALEKQRLPAKQKAVLAYLVSAGQPTRIDEITDAVGCGTGPVHGLRDKGLAVVHRERRSVFELDAETVETVEDLVLSGQQKDALNAILKDIRDSRHSTVLLHGVTGSGKTEVYIQAIREVVTYGKQAIVLVPEISLTPQTIRRFRSRFDTIAVLHSHLTDAERHWHWQEIAAGRVQVVVGARSAIFAPTPQLGLIIIDEEHETTFKQDTTPRYHAREVARKRAEAESIPLVLGSATPTLESWQRVQTGQDVLLSMPDRVADRPMPPVSVIDTRNDPEIAKGASIGRAMANSIRQALQQKGQIILFLNLRGYSPTLWCHACGTTVRCPNCDVTLTWHKDRNEVLCHSCDYVAPPPQQCPNCQSKALRYFGTGTQRLEQEVRSRFPGSTCLRMDSDTMRKPGSHDAALERFRSGEVSILLGTQMIAKGLDFPNVTLVGVINADTMLNQPDLRASERTFQLVAQVAGRTGRGDLGGRVLVQSSSPDDPAIQCAAQHDYLTFVSGEMAARKEMMAPPFTHWVRIVLRSDREETVQVAADDAATIIRSATDAAGLEIMILGPAPAPVTRLKGLYRYHLQMVTTDLDRLRDVWRQIEADLHRISGVEFAVDVDPVNMR